MIFSPKTLATFFGLGFTPTITGSVGSLGAIPLFLLLSPLSGPLYFLTVITLTVLAVWVTNLALPSFQDTSKPDDPSPIVLDEVVGFLWALGIVRYAGFWKGGEGLFWLLLIPFIFFRLFDITKWSLVGWAERKWSGGLGIVMDDLFAGIFAGFLSMVFCIAYPLVVYFFASLL